jgi:hypothetical protein
MNKKLERELNGPSATEVILGAILSLVLGAALAAVYLVLKPVATVKEIPKEPAEGVVYYIEGSRNSANAREAVAKHKSFLQGGTVVLNEDELNALAAAATAPATPAKADGKAAPAAPPQSVAAGSPNFRIRDGVLQIGVPVNLNVAGFSQKVIVQARGGFEKQGERFVFAPNEYYVGSCPLQNLPVAKGLVMKKVAGAAAVPEDLSAAWGKLSDVAVEGSTLKLTM